MVGSYRSERKLQPVSKQNAGSLSLFSSQARAAWRLDRNKLTLAPKGRWRGDTHLTTLRDGRIETVPLKLTSFCLISTGTLQNFAFLGWKTPMAEADFTVCSAN